MFDSAHASPDHARAAMPPPGTEVAVRPWADALVDRFGHDPRSPYVEHFWLPIVGPSGTLLLRWLAGGFDTEPEGYRVDLTDVARALGLGRRDGPSASFRRTLDRVGSFGFARLTLPQPATGATAGADAGEAILVVRRRLPALTRRQVQRLPRALRDDHDSWIATQPAHQGGQPADEPVPRRSDDAA